METDEFLAEMRAKVARFDEMAEGLAALYRRTLEIEQKLEDTE